MGKHYKHANELHILPSGGDTLFRIVDRKKSRLVGKICLEYTHQDGSCSVVSSIGNSHSLTQKFLEKFNDTIPKSILEKHAYQRAMEIALMKSKQMDSEPYVQIPQGGIK